FLIAAGAIGGTELRPLPPSRARGGSPTHSSPLLRMATVALTIDYSNGAQKHFSSIPWKEGLTVLEAIRAIEGIPPKASITFGSDRSGHGSRTRHRRSSP